MCKGRNLWGKRCVREETGERVDGIRRDRQGDVNQ